MTDAELQDQVSVINVLSLSLLVVLLICLMFAGKRASLSDLSVKLIAIDGVEDGVFFVPEKKICNRATGSAGRFFLASAGNYHRVGDHDRSCLYSAPVKESGEDPRNEMGKTPRKLFTAALEHR